ncbi:MAG: hypothetical protein CSA36_05090 [Draconibacterium sp.]|nr:MAG: hypothetical protein CSA36_05090 [Draconibacterium sp.]
MKRASIFFLLLLLSFISKAQLNINHYIRVGQTRIQIENYTGAIEYFNIVIKFKPYLPEAYFYRGIAKHQLEDYRGAIKDYDKAIEIKPFYPQAYTNRGMAYHNLKDYKKAIEDYNKALEFEPDNENVYNNRGIAKLALKDFEGAVEDYDKALDINPKSTYALMNRSNAKIVEGNVKGAIRDLNKVIIIRPHYAGAYLNRGLARFEMEDYASALRDYDQCIRFDPKNALAFNNRGIVKHKLEDYAGAIMDYDMALQLNPEMASAYFNRGMAREILHRPGFEKDYKIAARLNPQFDLEARKLDAEQMAQNQQKQQTTGNNNSQQTKNQATTQNKTNNKGKSDDVSAAKKRRRRNLVIEDSRNLPDNEEVKDGKVQNKNIIIDLQPIFVISAFEKNAVDYDRFQYYNVAIDEMNAENNYNPLLTITNKPVNAYQSIFENFTLYFNERIKILASSHNYLNRGIFYLLTEDYNQAMQDINESIKLNDKQGIAYFSRANCQYKMLEKMELLMNESSGQSITIGSLNNTNNNTPITDPSAYEPVLDDLELTLFLNPKFFFGYFNRAYIKLRLGEYKSAIEDLNRAIELEPEFAEAYFNRGLTKIFMDDVDGGALDLSRAGELGIEGAYNVIKRYCN